MLKILLTYVVASWLITAITVVTVGFKLAIRYDGMSQDAFKMLFEEAYMEHSVLCNLPNNPGFKIVVFVLLPLIITADSLVHYKDYKDYMDQYF